LLLCGVLTAVASAETFQLNDGQILSGEIVSYNENGLIVRLPDDKYSDRVPWSNFSQVDLRKLAQNSKIAPLVEPFIEVTQAERIEKTQIPPKPVPRLERPGPHSLLGAMFGSSVGIFTLLLLYAANIYAGYEISIFRARPVALVCGVAAVAPVIGPIIFLAMPMQIARKEAEESEPQAATQDPAFALPSESSSQPVQESDSAPAHGGGLRLAHSETAPSETSAAPQAQVFQRGAFTFNRRFFETKFSGFFGVVRRDADKNTVLVVKAARGHYVAQRITRITANDVHLQVQKGPASEEVMVPFSEIQEIQLKTQDA
jgi:hypothetical protein